MSTTVTASNLANMTNIRGNTRKVDGKTIGILVFDTDSGTNLEMPLSQFDAIYKSFVNAWPTVKPLKESLVDIQREEGKAEREATKAAEKAKRDEERKQAKADMASKREADKAKKAAEKAQAKAEAAKQKAEAAAKKAEEDIKAAEQKKAEDTKKLQEAADRLAKTGSAKVTTAKTKK